MTATAVDAWDDRWATPEGRADWLVPHPAVAALVPVLKARGTEHVLDLGCGVGRHALLFAEFMTLRARRSRPDHRAAQQIGCRRSSTGECVSAEIALAADQRNGKVLIVAEMAPPMIFMQIPTKSPADSEMMSPGDTR